MTALEHYLEAERLAGQAETWADADMGWKGSLTTEERIQRRTADLAAAQVHATLAGVHAHNRATTELTGLLQAMIGWAQEAREATS